MSDQNPINFRPVNYCLVILRRPPPPPQLPCQFKLIKHQITTKWKTNKLLHFAKHSHAKANRNAPKVNRVEWRKWKEKKCKTNEWANEQRATSLYCLFWLMRIKYTWPRRTITIMATYILTLSTNYDGPNVNAHRTWPIKIAARE